jgi:protease-4
MPRLSFLPLLLVALAACGCRHMQVTTRAIVSMEQPIRMNMADEGPVYPRPVEGPPGGAPTIAVIDIDGPLLNQPVPGTLIGGDTAASLFRERLRAAATDPQVCGVVLRINSPGGSVTATEIMVRELHRFKAETGLPVVACLMDLGTGGAYYLATAADVIVAHPTTVTGGVGVIVNLFNLRETMAALNVLEQSIKSGPHIDMGASTRELDEATKTMLQQISDDFHQRFKDAVRATRPRLVREEEVFSGRIFHGRQALDVGLVDHVGFLDDAVDVVKRMSGRGDAQVVMYRRGCDMPHSVYETSDPLRMPTLFTFNMPGMSRKSLPLFLYMWLPELTMP